MRRWKIILLLCALAVLIDGCISLNTVNVYAMSMPEALFSK